MYRDPSKFAASKKQLYKVLKTHLFKLANL